MQGPVEQPIAVQCVGRRSVKRTAEAAAAEEDGSESGQTRHGDSRGVFAAKCLAVQRNESGVTVSFHCKNLLGHSEYVKTFEFSNDGKFLASGGYDKIVRLWPISEARRKNEATPIAPTEMKRRHISSVFCLAFAPDNRRLFSGGLDGQIFIHDVET